MGFKKDMALPNWIKKSELAIFFMLDFEDEFRFNKKIKSFNGFRPIFISFFIFFLFFIIVFVLEMVIRQVKAC